MRIFSSFPRKLPWSAPPKRKERLHFSVGEVIKFVLAFMAFLLLTLWGVRTIRSEPKTGWMATIVFGTMMVLAGVTVFRLCSADEVPVVEAKLSRRLRSSLIRFGTVLVSIFLGVADNLIAEAVSPPYGRPAVWLAAFVTTLAFIHSEIRKKICRIFLCGQSTAR